MTADPSSQPAAGDELAASSEIRERPGPLPWVFPLMAGLAAAWLIGLAVLAATTANPVQVSVPQVVAADVVVAADRDGGEWVVSEVLSPTAAGLKAGDRLTLDGSPEFRTAVLPLSRAGQGWTVTPVPKPNGPRPGETPLRLSYPDTEAVRTAVDAAAFGQ